MSFRFSQVVAAAGEPAPHAFWVPPEKDAEFQRALKAHRVMTVAPRARGKADVGRVGFETKGAQQGQVLLFPKSLKRFEGAEIVGVKFELVEQPETVAARTELRRTTAKTKRAKKPSSVPAKAGATSGAVPAKAGATSGAVLSDSAGESKGARRQTSEPSAPRSRERKTPDGGSTGSKDYDRLAQDVRAALSELRDGKAVAAYQRLERAIGAK